MCFANWLWKVVDFSSIAVAVVCKIQVTRRFTSCLEIKKFFYSSCELYLRSLISDQVSRLQTRGIRASIVNVSKEPKPEFASDEELDDTGYEPTVT